MGMGWDEMRLTLRSQLVGPSSLEAKTTERIHPSIPSPSTHVPIPLPHPRGPPRRRGRDDRGLLVFPLPSLLLVIARWAECDPTKQPQKSSRLGRLNFLLKVRSLSFPLWFHHLINTVYSSNLEYTPRSVPIPFSDPSSICLD